MVGQLFSCLNSLSKGCYCRRADLPLPGPFADDANDTADADAPDAHAIADFDADFEANSKVAAGEELTLPYLAPFAKGLRARQQDIRRN